jgi:hypothetical protein
MSCHVSFDARQVVLVVLAMGFLDHLAELSGLKVVA